MRGVWATHPMVKALNLLEYALLTTVLFAVVLYGHILP